MTLNVEQTAGELYRRGWFSVAGYWWKKTWPGAEGTVTFEQAIAMEGLLPQKHPGILGAIDGDRLI